MEKTPIIAEPTRLTFSIIVPCYDQGRFLTDCLESLAWQSEPPAQVIVVNDGSTEEETKAILERLPCYHYPFALRVCHQPNKGPEAARNLGMAHCQGDIIILLDADDKLLPDGLAAFRRAFESQPSVDAFYSDVYFFGKRLWLHLLPEFNAWRQCQDNFMVMSTAFRRKVFDLGYQLDERIRHRIEDWDYWSRTCSLGPFKAAPLKEFAFGYRQIGFSGFSSVRHPAAIPQMRALHAEAGLWSADVERRLRNSEAPTHCLASPVPQQFADADDMLAVAENELDNVLAGNVVPRFLWLGTLPPQARPSLQMILNEVARLEPAAAYVFRQAGDGQPFLVVLDRRWVLQHPHEWDTPVARLPKIVAIQCRGRVHSAVREITHQRKFHGTDAQLLGVLGARRARQLLPRAPETDGRIWNDLRFYLAREPDIPRLLVPEKNQRVLAIAAPNRPGAAPTLPLRRLLEERSLRDHVAKVLMLHLESLAFDGPPCFESLADGCLDLGNASLADDRRIELTMNLFESCKVTDLLVADAALGYELIPIVRKARLPIRINALVFEPCADPSRAGWAREPALRATEFANLLDRVASNSDALTARMIDHCYFPVGKIKTVPIDAAASSDDDYARRLIRWLFDRKSLASRVEYDSLFGVNKAV